MLERGQLIVSGGGISIRQLTTGQYEISVKPSDARNNNDRAGDGSSGGGSGSGEPGEPVDPNKPPALPGVPELPTDPNPPGSGDYGGPTTGDGRTIQGAVSPNG